MTMSAKQAKSGRGVTPPEDTPRPSASELSAAERDLRSLGHELAAALDTGAWTSVDGPRGVEEHRGGVGSETARREALESPLQAPFVYVMERQEFLGGTALARMFGCSEGPLALETVLGELDISGRLEHALSLESASV